MKINKFISKYFLLLVLIHSNAQIVSKKIGTNPMEINPAAALELESTTKGFLPPRMVDSQRDAISSPSTGLIIWCINCGIYGELQMYNGYNWVNLNLDLATAPSWGTVTSGLGRTWMDRNLGASRIATSSTDALAYGDLYQWGRGTDGHEKRNSPTTSSASSNIQPGHSSFITQTTGRNDWLVIQNDNLWQGVNGVNNPCPSGLRIPTMAEWNAELTSWGTYTDTFNNPLKLPRGGERLYTDGVLQWVNTYGSFYSSTISGVSSLCFGIAINFTSQSAFPRSYGKSVRCILNY